MSRQGSTVGLGKLAVNNSMFQTNKNKYKILSFYLIYVVNTNF